MSRTNILVIGLVLLTLLSSFVKTLFESVGIPNVLPAIRDPLLIGLTLYGIGKLDFFSSKKWLLLFGSLLVFVSSYLFIAMIEDRAFVGLYYIRIYLLPILFFIGAFGIFNHSKEARFENKLLNFLIYWNALLLATSVTLYVILQNVPTIRTTLFGHDLLPTAWYISGGTWMRMGLPLSGPNTLGLVFALNAFVFLGIMITQKDSQHSLHIKPSTLLFSAILAIAGLMLSFSRSSMLILFVSIPLFILFPGVMTFNKFFKYSFVGLSVLTLLVVFSLIVDEFSDGFVTRWVVLNTSFSDPSMLGHFTSITDALDKLHEYALWGYPKGTVGPKSVIFTGITNNVENSFLAVAYDMGLIFAAVYGVAVAALLSIGYKNRLQLVLLIGFFPPCFLLPYVFEADALIYFAFIYLLLGVILHKPFTENNVVSYGGPRYPTQVV